MCNTSLCSGRGNGSGSEQHIHTWGQHSLPKQHSRCSACSTLPCSALHTSLQEQRDLFHKFKPSRQASNFQRKNITLPPQRQERNQLKTNPHVHLCSWGWGTASGWVLLREPQRCPSCGSWQGLKSRPALWPSVQERQETPALPSKAQVSL